MNHLKAIAALAIAAVMAIACSDGSDNNANPEPEQLNVRELVETLAADEMNGRDNLTAGSLLAQKFLIKELEKIAEPAFPELQGAEGYLQHYAVGSNILAIVRGGELPEEYVMIGAHYDHLGNNCYDITADDNICNGANDNATGVAAVIDIVRSIVADGVPRRSIIITLWDGEEDGLVGAKHYVQNPVFPLEKTVAYVNFDIQGANLLPSLRESTILVGAETGGESLVAASQAARTASTLDTLMLSLLFGQGRSDHAVLTGVGVPSVFFTDANNGCYHTVKDDINAVDFPKLEQQIRTANALTRDLVATDSVPVFDATAPVSAYSDAVELLRVVEIAQTDLGLFPPDQQVAIAQFQLDLQAIVNAGPEAFDAQAVGTLLGGAAMLVSSLRALDCDPYLSEN
jgi:Peptidase family M28